jgi:hypothetical protein
VVVETLLTLGGIITAIAAYLLARTADSEALALVLAKYLPVSRRWTHLKGHGGAKYAVRAVRDHLAASRFVLRTDVKSYYASIDHLMLLDQLAVHIKDRRVLNLIGQYLRRTSERGGTFWDYEKGISLGGPLGPLSNAASTFCVTYRPVVIDRANSRLNVRNGRRAMRSPRSPLMS